MTREQAKREIDFLDYYLQNHTDDYGEESHTAMMMAIQALEQESCDAISREDAIKQCGFGMTSLLIADNLRKLPSVKPQEPTGHWIIMGDRYIKCSKCGHITKTESPDIYHFCMVCGANMSEIPTSSKPEISSYYGLKSYVRERSE